MPRANLNLFETDPDKVLLCFVTMDETLVHHFTAESKQQFNNGSTLAQRRQRLFSQMGRLWPRFFGHFWYSYGRFSPKRPTNDGT